MTVDAEKTITVNRPQNSTWERFETILVENTEREANTQAFGFTDGLWIYN